jgi:FAD dependent oxidoreductase TIGR03364
VKLVVVGGGVIGTALALEAVDRGHEVVQLEREQEPRGASVRNFGLVWICGRAGGRELELALEGRRRWELLARRAPAIGFRATGSVVLARSPAEIALAEAACSRADAGDRGFRMLTPAEARTLEPALGEVAGAMHSPLDAVVEPAGALAALRALAGHRFLAGRTVVEADGSSVRDHRGERTEGDLVALCTGTATELLPAVDGLVRRNLQMLATAPLSTPLRVAVAGGDAMRYYPAFDLPERRELSPPALAVDRHGAQLLVAPRADGRLTIGDTHVDDRPGRFGSDEEADRWLLEEADGALAVPLPPVERRWTGSYLRRDAGPLVETTPDGALVVGAVGGMGMTAAPAFAAEALDRVGL